MTLASYEIETDWRGAIVSVTVRSKAIPVKRAKDLCSALGCGGVKIWLLRGNVRHLVWDVDAQ